MTCPDHDAGIVNGMRRSGPPPEEWDPQARSNLRARDKMVEWASRLDRMISRGSSSWTYFHTHTFRPDKSLQRHQALSAGPRLVSWCAKWASTLVGSVPFRLLLWSAEEHQTGLVHLHALSVVMVKALQRHCDSCSKTLALSPEWRMLKESWWVHWGKAMIRPYDPSLKFGAERYVTKYVLDEKCLDWGIEIW